MSNGFQLADVLMRIGSDVEQRKARKEQLAFQKAYEAPLKEAYTNYMNAQTQKMLDPAISDLRDEQTRKTGFEADRLKVTLDAIDEMRKKDPENPLILQAVAGISDNKSLRDEIEMMKVNLQKMGVEISQKTYELGVEKFNAQKLWSLTDFLTTPEGQEFVSKALGKEALGEAKRKTTEKITGEKAAPPDERPTLEKVRDWLGIIDFGEKMKSVYGLRKSSKSALLKAPSKARDLGERETTPRTEKEFSENLSKLKGQAYTDYHNKWSELFPEAERSMIDEGIQELVGEFPDLLESDIEDARKLLKKGEFTIEELIAHLRAKKE